MKLLLPAQRVYDAACATIEWIDKARERNAEAHIAEAMQGKWLRWTKVEVDRGSYGVDIQVCWRLRWRTRTREEAIEYLSQDTEYGLSQHVSYSYQYDDCEAIRDGAAAMLKDSSVAFVQMGRDEFRRISHWYLKP